MVFWLIHGAWHDETCWDLLRAELEQGGHSVDTPRLPIDDPEKRLADYAAEVLKEPFPSEPLVVVGHSMSSDVAAIVAETVRPRHLVYLCPRMAIFSRPEGEPAMYRENAFERLQVDKLGRSFWEVEDAVRDMYRSLDQSLARELAARLRPQADARKSPPPINRPPKVDSTFLYTTEDEIFRPEWSDWASRRIVGVEPIVWPGGHFPMIERPREFAELLAGL